MSDWRDHIVDEPASPSIKGSAVEVESVLRLLRDGWTIERVLARFPNLSSDDVRACLDFALELVDRARIRAEMLRRFADSEANPDSLIPNKQVMKELFPELPEDDEEKDDE